MDNVSTTDIYAALDQLTKEDWFGSEEAPDFIEELKECAVEIVMENPNINKEDWIDTLLRLYPCEVVDAYGTDEQEVFQALSLLWKTELADHIATLSTIPQP